MTTTLHIDNPAGVTFTVDPQRRTIRGLALPFGDVAESGGRRWRFSAGGLEWDNVKLLNAHDWSQVIGVATLEETPAGLEMTAKVAETQLGDELLALAALGAVDGLSVGLSNDLRATLNGDVNDVTAGRVIEVSTTPIPAFNAAKIRSVAASQEKETPTMNENNTPTADAATIGADTIARFDALEEKVKTLETFAAAAPTPAAATTVKEAPLYRFDGIAAASGYDYSTDFFAALDGDRAATDRLIGFMNEHLTAGRTFVDSADVASVNPATYRPDLFKDEQPARSTPLYDAFYAGALTSVTPFYYSKIDAYSNLIGPHTEGVEPTAGTFTTEEGATVTPTTVSGRVYITREMASQGGSAQVSALIAAKVQRAFNEALEDTAAGLLDANKASIAALATPSTGATGAALAAGLKQGFVNTLFDDTNGDRFTRFFAAKQLYSQLSAAVDDADRPLFPVAAPSNADGTTASRVGSIDLAGVKIEPTWALERKRGEPAAASNISYYADPAAVKIWNSGLTKLDKVGETAAGWNVDVFAWVAAHLYDVTGLRKVAYTVS